MAGGDVTPATPARPRGRNRPLGRQWMKNTLEALIGGVTGPELHALIDLAVANQARRSTGDET